MIQHLTEIVPSLSYERRDDDEAGPGAPPPGATVDIVVIETELVQRDLDRLMAAAREREWADQHDDVALAQRRDGFAPIRNREGDQPVSFSMQLVMDGSNVNN